MHLQRDFALGVSFQRRLQRGEVVCCGWGAVVRGVLREGGQVTCTSMRPSHRNDCGGSCFCFWEGRVASGARAAAPVAAASEPAVSAGSDGGVGGDEADVAPRDVTLHAAACACKSGVSKVPKERA
jgi:hypothetical protein